MAQPERRAIWVVSIAALLIVGGLAVYGIQLHRNVNDVRAALALSDQNAQRIEANQWLTCNDFNASFSRQNSVIDQAIGQEQRKGNPDPKTLDALRRFKLRLHSCGKRPQGVDLP